MKLDEHDENSRPGIYYADLTAEETDADVVTVEPDQYRSADSKEWATAEPPARELLVELDGDDNG